MAYMYAANMLCLDVRATSCDGMKSDWLFSGFLGVMASSKATYRSKVCSYGTVGPNAKEVWPACPVALTILTVHLLLVVIPKSPRTSQSIHCASRLSGRIFQQWTFCSPKSRTLRAAQMLRFGIRSAKSSESLRCRLLHPDKL